MICLRGAPVAKPKSYWSRVLIAGKMAALATEAADYVERHRDERNSEGRALVVHNGRAKARKLKRRGMVAPVVAVGDGALGFWAAAREVCPETREQACWCHKLANVLDKLPVRFCTGG
jgi:hypothetical protein